MNREHEMVAVWPGKADVECRCGHLDKIGNLSHLRLHQAEPSPSEIEKAWRDAISFAQRKLNESNI